MALIKCEECGAEISSRAESCPNCGCPMKVKSNTVIGTNIKNEDLITEENLNIENNNELSQLDLDAIIKDVSWHCPLRINKIRQYLIDKYNISEKDAIPLSKKVYNESTKRVIKIYIPILIILFTIYGIISIFNSDSSNYAAQAQKEVRNMLSSNIIYGYTSYVVGQVYHVSCIDNERDNNGRHYIVCTVEYYPQKTNGLVAMDSKKIENVYGIGMKVAGKVDINYKYSYEGINDFKKKNCWNQDKSKGLSCKH